MVRRLAKGHWYAQRSSVCGLLHVVYPGLDAAGQAEVLGIVGTLSADAAAMVRRSLAEYLVHLIPLVAAEGVKTYIHPVFLTLAKDDQDSVRRRSTRGASRGSLHAGRSRAGVADLFLLY